MEVTRAILAASSPVSSTFELDVIDSVNMNQYGMPNVCHLIERLLF